MTDNGAMEDMRIELALPREEHYEGQSESAREEKSGKKATRKQILLRLDPAVHAALAKWAADDLRSVNAQIEVLLRRALSEAGRAPEAAPMRGRGRPRKDTTR